MPSLKAIEDAARVTGVSRRTLQRWVSAGRLTGYRITGDRRRFIDLDEIKRLREPKPVSKGTAEN